MISIFPLIIKRERILNKLNHIVKLSVLLILVIILSSCTTKQEKDPVFTEGSFLEMDGNGGKFYTDEDIHKAFAYREEKQKSLELFSEDNSFPVTLEIPLILRGEGDKSLAAFVTAGINDQKINMIFDTGAGVMILPLHILRGTLRMHPPFEERDFYYFVQKITTDKYSYDLMPGYSAASSSAPFGVIPWTFFGPFCDFFTIDYQEEKIILHSKNSNSFKSSVNPIPCEINEASHIIIDVELDGRKVRALLDTGWSGKGCILEGDGSYEIQSSVNEAMNTLFGTYNGFFNTHEVKEITIGSTKINGSELLLVTKKHYEEFPNFFPWIKDEGIDVCLGGRDFFSKCRFTIDYKNKLCWIEPYE